jgi:hypothetical protein
MKVSIFAMRRKIQKMQVQKTKMPRNLDIFALLLAAFLFLDGAVLAIVHAIQPTIITTQAQPIAILALIASVVMLWASTVTFRPTIRR